MTLKIARLGHRGDGIAEDGTLVARALPGEVVDGAAEEGRVAAPRILLPSPDRVAAPCTHYKACGSCALQHASDSFVANWKVKIVRKAMAARGLEAPMRNLAVSPPGSRRRAVFAARRTKSGALVGFHGRRSQSMTEVPGCLVLAPAILAALPALEELTALAGSRKGELSITVTTSENGLDIALNGGKPLDANLRQIVSDIAQMHGIARLTADGELIAARAPPIQRFGTARVTPPPGAFLQATPQGQAALTSAMVEAVGEARGIVDLFSGCGTFTFPAAERAAVHAVESDADMITALDQAQRHSTGLKPVTGEVRDLFRRPLRSEELARFDAAIIDPPRAGAEAQTAALAEAALARIAFVSCNPVTFARDAEILTGAGYRLDWIDVIDQFRWSPHIELAAGFRRAT